MSTATAVNGPATDDVWGMEVKPDSGGGEYVLCPSGNYPSTIVGLFDVGHQPETNSDGEAYEARKLVVVFELQEQRPDGKPFLLAERYTWSMKSNSNFYSLASNLTGKSFAEGDKFDPRTLLGMTVMVQVVHKDGKAKKDGKTKTYHNVGSITQYPKGLPKPAATIAPVVWSALSGQSLPDVSWAPHVYGSSIRDLVQTSREYKAGKVPSLGDAPSASPAASAQEDDDAPPF